MTDTEATDPHLYDLPTFSDERGSLSVAESGETVPFDLKRVYYLYNVPPDTTRGEHAHRQLEQVMIAVSGSLEVVLETELGKQTFRLASPEEGLYIPTMAWRELTDFSADAVCVVLASRPYEPEDYIHEYETFREELDAKSSGQECQSR